MTKKAVLSILRKESNFVSGEKISTRLGISRAAVNTAVKALRVQGYEIESSTNKGYCLKAVPDSLTEPELGEYLSGERMEAVLCLPTVDSTNVHLRRLAFDGAPEGQVVLANEQTDGRGRRGRSFQSLKDKGIYLSMLFRPDSLPGDVTEITAWTAVAVGNAIEHLYGLRPEIKWVNDLLMKQKKICGILTEMSVEGGQVQHIIIGVGINVNEDKADFTEELSDKATSLAIETGKKLSRARLAAEVIKELDAMRQAWPDGKQSYLDAYRQDNITLGKEILVLQGDTSRKAEATAIGEDFSLHVTYEDGSQEILNSGEVSIRSLNGYS